MRFEHTRVFGPAACLYRQCTVPFTPVALLPTHRPPPIARLDFRKVGCDAATRVSNASCHLAVVASNVVLDSDLSEKSSSIGRGRLFPIPFGRTSNHHSSVSDSSDMLSGSCTSLLRISRELSWVSFPRRTLFMNVSNLVLRVRSGGCMYLSFCAARFLLCRASLA